MKFTKMHGIGNDYVYVNCFEETVSNPSAVAKFVSDRHFGIGSDGLILIKPSDIADCEMDMYNLDGSQGAMCGNGIRCVAKYAYDYGIFSEFCYILVIDFIVFFTAEYTNFFSSASASSLHWRVASITSIVSHDSYLLSKF